MLPTMCVSVLAAGLTTTSLLRLAPPVPRFAVRMSAAADSAELEVDAPAPTEAPAAPAVAADPFEAFSATFNDVCYSDMFLWIPRYKEAGFSTFRFEDFIDGRIRRIMPTVRLLVLHAAAPAVFGAPYSELPAMLGFEKASQLDKAYSAHASKQKPFEMGLPSLFDIEGPGAIGGDANKLYEGLQALARSKGGSSGDELLQRLTDTVEQTSALTCNMLAASKLRPKSLPPLDAEQASVLKGQEPDAPITPATLNAMPLLDAFAKESLDGLLSSGASDPLALPMAKVVYVHARRMFDEIIFAESPPVELRGSPLCTIGERVEVLVKPKMYYELQRGVKKLRF